ncbi:hypothetical protein J6590_057285 [Homalodisca vitripennis]|nr:hypothetical protein J6590_057285 [Homalodisca vitripennis]
MTLQLERWDSAVYGLDGLTAESAPGPKSCDATDAGCSVMWRHAVQDPTAPRTAFNVEKKDTCKSVPTCVLCNSRTYDLLVQTIHEQVIDVAILCDQHRNLVSPHVWISDASANLGAWKHTRAEATNRHHATVFLGANR